MDQDCGKRRMVIWVDDEFREEVNEAAKQEGWFASQYIRRAVRTQLNKDKKGEADGAASHL